MVVPRLLRVVIAAVATVTVVGACDEGSRQDRFCRRLGEEQGLLATVPTDPGELDDFVNRYRELAGIAPLAIEEQWQTITDLVEAVAIEDLEDPATADRLRDQAVAATRPVEEVRSYAQAVCGGRPAAHRSARDVAGDDHGRHHHHHPAGSRRDDRPADADRNRPTDGPLSGLTGRGSPARCRPSTSRREVRALRPPRPA